MTKKSGCERATCDPRQEQSTITGEANQQRKQGQSNGSSGRHDPTKKTTWKKYLTFLSMFHNKMKHKKQENKATSGFKRRRNQKGSISPILQECSNLLRVIRRTAADCFAADSAAGDEDDKLPCYMQLNRVNYGVKREAFGPIYLVT